MNAINIPAIARAADVLSASAPTTARRIAVLRPGAAPKAHARVIMVPCLNKLRARMQQHARGWIALGNGEFSRAYGKGKLVWKISLLGRGSGDGGRAYAYDCARGVYAGFSAAPKVRLMLVDQMGDWAVLTERLDGNLYDATLPKSDSAREVLRNAEGWSEATPAARRKAKADLPELARLCTKVMKRYRTSWSSDMHQGNVMRRPKDGAWVLNDPLSWPA